MFTIHKRNLGDTTPFDYLPIKDGQAAMLGSVYKTVSGKAVLCTATDKPKYLCAGVARADGLTPMIKIMRDMELCTVSADLIPDTLIGTAVTLGANAATVTATTASGVFTLSGTSGIAGGTVYGYFE